MYPGVAKSIENDINNLMGVISVWNVIPKGLYVDSVIEVAKMELAWEVDYIREARGSKIFKELLRDDPTYYIPEVVDELTTGQVLTSEYLEGLPLDKCFGLDQDTKNMYPGVAKSIENDINNLMGVISVWNVIPKGLYVDSVIEVAKMELAWEVDYIREARGSKIFKELLRDDPTYYIPEVVDELTTGQVLTSEYLEGLPLDKCFGLDQDTKNMYPGVAKSIENDINNLMGVISVWNVIPKGLYVDSVIEVAKMELAWEVDYIREARGSKIFKELLRDDPTYYIPEVVDELTTGQVLTSEYLEGLPLVKCFGLDQDTKNMLCDKILGLCLRELFEFKFMQTDPNWANVFYNPDTDKVILLDFGATRSYSVGFVDGYIKIINSAADNDREGILTHSRELGFLTGYETKEMEQAHVDAVMILGEAFHTEGGFDFGKQDTTKRVNNLIPVMLKHRLTPSPEETYSLHRKMAGAFLLCAKLGAKVDCRGFFEPIYAKIQRSR